METSKAPVPIGFRVNVIMHGHDFLLETGEFGQLRGGASPHPRYFSVAGSTHELEEELKKHPGAVSVPMTIPYQ